MISGWSKLQFPLGSDSHGRGTFTLAPPSIASRPFKEHIFSICRRHGDRGGLEPHNDSISFPESKTTVVEDLLGALINATEILDEYANPSCVSSAFKGLLGFDAHDLALATDPGHAHALPHGEPLQLLSHERSSHGSSTRSPMSSPDRNALHGSLRLASNTHTLHSVRSSSSLALRSDNISRGHQDVSVNTIRSSDLGHSHHNDLSASSEEEVLLQEARLKAFRSRTEPDGLRQASSSSDGLVKIVDALPPHSKQAKGVSKCEPHMALEGHAECGGSWLFTELTTLSRESSLFFGGIALSMLLVKAFFVTCQSSFFMRGRFQRPSVKRRILKSQWYGNPGSQLWGHRNFQMRISEFPKYPMLEVDGDKKLLRFPADSSGTSAAAFAKKSGSDLPGTTNADLVQPVRQTINCKPIAQVSIPRMAQGKPIRQTIHSSKALSGQQHGPNKVHPHTALNGKALSNVEWPSQLSLANDCRETREEQRNEEFSPPIAVSMKNRAHRKVISSVGLHGRGVSEAVQENVPIQRTSRTVASKSRIDESHWGKDDELDLDQRIQKLYQTIQAVEQHRRAAMLALEEERQRSMALEEEMVKQREASAVLGEEVRLLKESHSALLTSLRKKYSTSAAARTAADLVYQEWERHAAAE